MSERIFIKPAPGLTVVDPATLQPLPAEGVHVDAGDLHWARAIRDGDVEEALPPEPREEPPTPPAKARKPRPKKAKAPPAPPPPPEPAPPSPAAPDSPEA